jgi:flagellar assembly protein FliH
MSSFKLTDFKINTEKGAASTQIQISEHGDRPKPVVKSFELNELKKPGQQGYEGTKAKYGSLAATDAKSKGSEASQSSQRAAQKTAQTVKDQRFSLNPMLKHALSIDEEEQRAIEEKVRARVEELLQIERTQASQKGYEDGLKKGFQEAYQKTQQESETQLHQLGELVSSFENAKTEIYRANERFLIDLIFRISKMVLLKDLEIDRDYLTRLAKELIGSVAVRDNIKIRVSTEDQSLINALNETLQKHFGVMNNLHIETSSQIARGDCQIETEWHAIDAKIDTQLQRIQESLTGSGPGSTS